MPPLAGFPEAGILQFFASATDWYDAEDYQVLYHADPTAAPQTDFSFLTPDLYEDSPIYVAHALAFRPATEYGNPEDCHSNLSFDGKDYYAYQETLSEAQRAQLDACCNSAGHKLGGYACFTQGDPRDYTDGNSADIQLLQLDTDEEMMFGDSGVAHLFISPEALAARQFDQAYFYWDCC